MCSASDGGDPVAPDGSRQDHDRRRQASKKEAPMIDRIIPGAAVALTVAFVVAILIGAAAAKDMFYILPGEWCSGVFGEQKITIIKEDGNRAIMFDGLPGEAPRCELLDATNKSDPLGSHIMKWLCDRSPPPEPEDRPTPKSKRYMVIEKITLFVRRDKEGGGSYSLIRETPGKEARLYGACE